MRRFVAFLPKADPPDIWLAGIPLVCFLIGCIAYAPVTPYRVTNYFRSSKIENIKRIAVIPFKNLTKENAAQEIVTSEFNLQLGKLKIFDLVERKRIEEIFKEQDLDTLRFDKESIAKIGELLGVQGLILGSVTKFIPYPESYKENHYTPPIIIYDRHRKERWEIWMIVVGTILVIPMVYYLFFRPRPKTAEVGISARLVDTQTGEQLWQAKEAFKGDRSSIQTLVKTDEDKDRLIYDADFLTRILCQELVKTILR